MAMDMTIMRLEGAVQIQNDIARRMVAEADVDTETTHERLRIICSKVLKYLMTAKGSDAFDPTYGGTALHGHNVGEAMLPELRLKLIKDIADCVAYLKEAEFNKTSNYTERLESVTLVSLDYDRKLAPTELRIRLRIITTYGNVAVVEA